MKIDFIFALICFCCVYPITYMKDFWTLTFLLWFTLFFGGMVVPVSTGILVSCVKKELQAASSSTSMLLFNLFG